MPYKPRISSRDESLDLPDDLLGTAGWLARPLCWGARYAWRLR